MKTMSDVTLGPRGRHELHAACIEKGGGKLGAFAESTLAPLLKPFPASVRCHLFRICKHGRCGFAYAKALRKALGASVWNKILQADGQPVVVTSHELKEEEYGYLRKDKALLKQAEMKKEDAADEMATNYSTFWETLRAHYSTTFRPKDVPDYPRTLDDFVDSAGVPPHVIGVDRNLFLWPPDSNLLNESQRRMWRFVQEIYPSRGDPSKDGDVWMHSAITPQENAERFHMCRRRLSKYWDMWPPLVGLKFISDRYMTRRRIILLLAWLELALIKWTQMPGAHKQSLFKVAERLARVTK